MTNTNDTSDSHFDYEKLIKKVHKFVRSKSNIAPGQVKGKFAPAAIAGKCSIASKPNKGEFVIRAAVNIELSVGGVWCGEEIVHATYACGENYFEAIETTFNSIDRITENRFQGKEKLVATFGELADWIDAAIVAAVDAAVLMKIVPAGAVYQHFLALESQSKPKKKVTKKKK